MTGQRVRTGRLPGWLPLWFGVAGGQAAWGLAVLVAYPTVAMVCNAGASTVWIHLVRWSALVVALAATVVAHRCWRIGQEAGDDAPAALAARVRFMGLGGVLLSGAGAFLLVVEDMATWVIDPCL
ncbi:MAG TPA: hypothetical protein VM287_13090 [Egibacteraceae bacterium]|nr:hypothetical protein [Egibacteraceae bacterium]